MGKPVMNGNVCRNERSASGWSEDYTPTDNVSAGRIDGTFEGSFPGLGSKGKVPFVKSAPKEQKKSGVMAPKIPGKGSPQNTKPSVKPKPQAGPKTHATGQQTTNKPSLVGY